ncbi:MAG: TrmB family transcriptional regulator sugar-binding domain-containing protein, partial [Candidatus Heimdallarchaeota archaeon]
KIEEKIDLSKIEIKDILSLSRMDSEDIIQNLIKNIINENSDKIDTTTTIMQEAGTKLDNTLGNTIFLLDDSGKTFDGIVNMSEKVMPLADMELSLIYGNECIVRAMKDMLLRAKEEITIITPEILTDFLYEIEKQPQITNYQLVSKIKEEDVSLLTSLVKRGNVNTMNYKGMDFWIAIKDNEEILYAPKIHPEKNIAFITTNPKLFQLFFDLTNQKVFSQMKAQEFQS